MSISCEDLTFSYGGAPVLSGVSFSVRDGEFAAVLGPNGAGKTTLFRCILGLSRRYGGKVLIDSRDARTLSARSLASSVAYIPQRREQPFGYTVFETVLMGTTHALAALSQPGARERAKAADALCRLGIEALGDKYFSRISGGEQQLALIARALAQNAKTLVMDEPTSSLDYGNEARVLSAARSLADSGYTVLMSTHSPQQAVSYADTAVALQGGHIIGAGAPRSVLTSAMLKTLYGVEAALVDTGAGLIIAPWSAGRQR